MTPTESYICVWRLAAAIEEISGISRATALDVAYDAMVHINENDLHPESVA